MNICDGCKCQEGCVSPCYLANDPGEGEERCSEYNNCKRIKRWLGAAPKELEEAVEHPATMFPAHAGMNRNAIALLRKWYYQSTYGKGAANTLVNETEKMLKSLNCDYVNGMCGNCDGTGKLLKEK